MRETKCHVLVAELREGWYDAPARPGPRGMTYRIECPYAEAERPGHCGALEQCGCVPDDDWQEMADAEDLCVYDWIEAHPDCPLEGREHRGWESEVMVAGGDCWPQQMIEGYDMEPAYVLALTTPGRYPISWTSDGDGCIELDLIAKPAEVSR